MKIDLGCGTKKIPGFTGVDLWEGNNPDIVADIMMPIEGLAPGCADEVICWHVMEHLGNEGWTHVFKEIRRLLIVGGKFEVRVPHPSSEDSMILGHIHVLTPLFWRRAQEGNWVKGLRIEEVIEVPDKRCQEFCRRNGLLYDDWCFYLRNSFEETIVKGVKL